MFDLRVRQPNVRPPRYNFFGYSASRLLGFSAIRLFGSRADVGGTANGPRAPPRAPSTRSGRIPWPADGPESATHEHATRTRSERPDTRRTASTATACTNHAPAGPNALVRIHAPDASSKAIVEIDPRRADCAPPDPTAGAAGPAGRQTCYRHRPGREIRRRPWSGGLDLRDRRKSLWGGRANDLTTV